MRGFSIERRIGIDMGHRVPTHGSKCWNFHGHRYEILAEAVATDLHKDGEQMDMVLDFSFLKVAMMDYIDNFHDHGVTLWQHDPWLPRMLKTEPRTLIHNYDYLFLDEQRDVEQTRLMVVNFIPTAERLAEFWYHRMRLPVQQMSNNRAKLLKLTVFETPNNAAIFPREYT